jgi:hypothetical protein
VRRDFPFAQDELHLLLAHRLSPSLVSGAILWEGRANAAPDVATRQRGRDRRGRGSFAPDGTGALSLLFSSAEAYLEMWERAVHHH